MPKQPEAILQDKIVAALRGRGFYACKTRLAGRKGWPDVYALKEGWAYHLEVKMPGKKPDPLQLYELGRLRAFGAVTAVVDSVDGALEVCGDESDE